MDDVFTENVCFVFKDKQNRAISSQLGDQFLLQLSRLMG